MWQAYLLGSHANNVQCMHIRAPGHTVDSNECHKMHIYQHTYQISAPEIICLCVAIELHVGCWHKYGNSMVNKSHIFEAYMCVILWAYFLLAHICQ